MHISLYIELYVFLHCHILNSLLDLAVECLTLWSGAEGVMDRKETKAHVREKAPLIGIVEEMWFGSGKHLLACCLFKVSYISALLKKGILCLNSLLWSARNTGSGVQEKAEIYLVTCTLPALFALYRQNEKKPKQPTLSMHSLCANSAWSGTTLR